MNAKFFGAIGACVLSAAVAQNAQAEVSSQVVGYSNVTVAKGWSFKTLIFKNVDTTKTIDLSNFVVRKSTGAEYGTSGMSSLKANNFYIRKMNTEGGYLDAYHYITCTSGSGAVAQKGWYKNGTEYVAENTVTLTDGEGLIISASKTDSVLVMSGEVDLVCKNTIGKGWSFSGNTTPASFKLNEITVKKNTGAEYGTSGMSSLKANNFYIRKMNTEGGYLDAYHYITCVSGSGAVAQKGWYKNGTTFVEDASDDNLTFAPGEGFIVSCSKTDAQLNLPCPIK